MDHLNSDHPSFANVQSATVIEYGLIAALVAVGIIVAASGLGDGISDIFTDKKVEVSSPATK